MSKGNDINRGIESTSIELEKALTENINKTVSTILGVDTVTSTAFTIIEVKTTATTI